MDRREIVVNTQASPNESSIVDRRYLLRREVGRGDVCVVYEAVHQITRRVVAVKRLLESHQNDEGLRGRLLHEAQVIAAVSHPNVVQVLDAGRDETGVPYVILEYLEGRSLEGLISARGFLRVVDALHIAKEVCSALSSIHETGVAHRDVKPSNILVLAGSSYENLQTARIKLIDFGKATSSSLGAAGGAKGGAGADETGRPEWMLGTEDPNVAAEDIFGVGATLFECLVGRSPLRGGQSGSASRTTAAPVPSLKALRPEVPDVVMRLVERALHRGNEDGFSDMAEMQKALVAATEAISLDSPVVDRSRRRHVRAPYITPARLTVGTQTIDGRTEDLSANGLMLLLPTMPAQDARVQIRFALPTTGAYVATQAIVRWRRQQEGRALSCAVGIEFTALQADARAAIETFVRIVGQEMDRRG